MQLTSRAELLPKETIAQLCKRGMVALIERYPDGQSRQVVLFARFEGPPEPIYRALMNVEAYPKYLNTIDAIDVIGRRNGLTVFSWTLDLPFFALNGTRMQRGQPPHIVESKGRTGHLRGSRERWELFPVEGGTLIAFYRALDIETGGFLLRTLVDLEPSTEAGANLSSGFIHLRGLEHFLAGRTLQASPKARTGPVHDLIPLDLAKGSELASLQPLLAHGQLAVIESFDDGALRQVALIGAAKTSAEKLHHVVSDAERYPEFMPNISRQKVTAQPDGRRQLEWTIKTPVSSMSGKALMSVGPSTVDVNAVEGDVKRARIHWRFVSTAEDRSIALYYTYSDIRSASWVTRRLLKAEPLLEHGMVAAAGMVALSAMTARAEGRR
ncbi:MAG: SRPBCC family protein [Myxococcota bacterium]